MNNTDKGVSYNVVITLKDSNTINAVTNVYQVIFNVANTSSSTNGTNTTKEELSNLNFTANVNYSISENTIKSNLT